MKKNIKIAIIAGEPSGDDLGGAIMTGLKRAVANAYPQATLTFIGVGGAKMAAAGLRSVFPMTKIAKMGLVELLPHLFEILYLLRKTISCLRAEKPDILITIDIPDFSKRVATALPHLTKIHLVAPTVWAWRAKRRFVYEKIFDALFCLYPFEKKYFADTNLKIFTMGHPLVAEVKQAKKKMPAPVKTGKKNKKPPQVLLLAGSRGREVKYTLPLLKEFMLQNDFLPTTTNYVFYTQPHLVGMMKKSLASISDKQSKNHRQITIISDYRDKWRWFLSSDLSLVCMGTATLEVALAGAPMVAIYKASWLTAFIVRRLIKVATICLPNLLAGKNIVPELVQEEMTLQNLITHGRQQFLLGRGGVKKNYDQGLKQLQAIDDPPSLAAAEIVKYL